MDYQSPSSTRHTQRGDRLVTGRRVDGDADGRSQLPKIVSLFSGAGGLDLGFQEEGFEIEIAFDISPAAIKTHKRNFPKAAGVADDLTTLGPAGVLKNVLSAIPPGTRIGIIGGPPCQGFSRANVSAKASDPRNELPKLYVKIIRKLQTAYSVDFVVFENVLGMRDAKHATKYKGLVRGLKGLGFHVSEQELCALDFGVPQARKRVVLAAVANGATTPNLRPRRRTGSANVREAIGALPAPVFFSRDLTAKDIPEHPNHWTMNPRSPRFTLGMNGREGRSFKLLAWDKPSPTIAFGHREIHVHPNGSRRLSILEAMLLQGFTKEFVLEGNLSEQVEQVSNAVPPPLARSLASAIRRCLQKAVKK